MTDSAHNTLVTLLLIIAAVFIFILLGRWLQTGTTAMQVRQYSYQPASVVEVFRDRPIVRSSTSYTYIPSTSYESSSSSYSQSTYSYSCDGLGHCWTNQ
jgi:hypothetical protein